MTFIIMWRVTYGKINSLFQHHVALDILSVPLLDDNVLRYSSLEHGQIKLSICDEKKRESEVSSGGRLEYFVNVSPS